MHGQFTWYELTTPDVDAAKRFYAKFTNWGTQAFDSTYTMFTTGGAPVAGIFRLNDEMRSQGVPPNWMPYIEAGDVDATAQQAASLGGAVVVPPSDIPDTGRFAVIRDPEGAVFGLYKSSRPAGGWDGKPVVNRFSWHELMSTDYPKAFAFYQRLFGWDNQGEMDMGGGMMYLMFGKGGMYGGMYNRTPDMANVPPFWLLYINVKDVGKALDAAVKAGATVVRGRIPIPGGTIAILADPQGAGFALHDVGMTAAPAATKVEQAGAAVKKAATKAVKAVKKAVAKAVRKVSKKPTKKPAKKKAVRTKTARKAVKKTARKPARKAAKTKSARRPARRARAKK